MRIVHITVFFLITMFSFSLAAASTAYGDELDDASSALEEAKASAEEALSAKEQADAAVAETQQEIEALGEQLPALQEKTNDVIRYIYRTGGDGGMVVSLLDIVLSSTSLADMIHNIEYLHEIAEYQSSVLSQAQSARESLLAEKEKLVAQQEQAQSALDEAESKKKEAQDAYDKAKAAADRMKKSSQVSWEGAADGGILTLSQMKFRGVVNYSGYRYTYYSQSVLPGGGLNIPGRHVENGCVVDGDGYIVVASSMHSKGTVVPTPLKEFPQGKVYDSGCAWGTLDLYIA